MELGRYIQQITPGNSPYRFTASVVIECQGIRARIDVDLFNLFSLFSLFNLFNLFQLFSPFFGLELPRMPSLPSGVETWATGFSDAAMT